MDMDEALDLQYFVQVTSMVADEQADRRSDTGGPPPASGLGAPHNFNASRHLSHPQFDQASSSSSLPPNPRQHVASLPQNENSERIQQEKPESKGDRLDLCGKWGVYEQFAPRDKCKAKTAKAEQEVPSAPYSKYAEIGAEADREIWHLQEELRRMTAEHVDLEQRYTEVEGERLCQQDIVNSVRHELSDVRQKLEESKKETSKANQEIQRSEEEKEKVSAEYMDLGKRHKKALDECLRQQHIASSLRHELTGVRQKLKESQEETFKANQEIQLKEEDKKRMSVEYADLERQYQEAARERRNQLDIVKSLQEELRDVQRDLEASKLLCEARARELRETHACPMKTGPFSVCDLKPMSDARDEEFFQTAAISRDASFHSSCVQFNGALNADASSRSTFSGARRKLVLAFDVGTTFSGISYSVLVPGEAPEIRGVTRFPAYEHINGASKIPTIIYYDRNGGVKAVGAEAMKEGIVETAEDEQWVKAEWFKLHLQSRIGTSKEVVKGIPPLPLNKSVVDVFADFLAYLFKCAAEYIQEAHANGADLWNSVKGQIDFVLSHPNGWEATQQSDLRRAATLAGLIPDTPAGYARLSFVTEGEASLHFTIRNGLPASAMKNGDGVVIIDAGGGTIDVSSYDKNPVLMKDNFKHIATPQCHFHGSVFVSIHARLFLENYLADSPFVDDIEHIVRCFDKTTKLTFRNTEEAQYIKFGSARDNDPASNIKCGQLKLLGSDVALFFEPSIGCIIKAVEEQRMEHKSISHVVLVGGFAANTWVFDRVCSALSPAGLNIIRPESNTNKAVSEGAISFYLESTPKLCSQPSPSDSHPFSSQPFQCVLGAPQNPMTLHNCLDPKLNLADNSSGLPLKLVPHGAGTPQSEKYESKEGRPDRLAALTGFGASALLDEDEDEAVEAHQEIFLLLEEMKRMYEGKHSHIPTTTTKAKIRPSSLP